MKKLNSMMRLKQLRFHNLTWSLKFQICSYVSTHPTLISPFMLIHQCTLILSRPALNATCCHNYFFCTLLLGSNCNSYIIRASSRQVFFILLFSIFHLLKTLCVHLNIPLVSMHVFCFIFCAFFSWQLKVYSALILQQ